MEYHYYFTCIQIKYNLLHFKKLYIYKMIHNLLRLEKYINQLTEYLQYKVIQNH